ncbi:LysR substrate-binding domain-containing protein [Roseovarius pacificus]|uniref:LysR substrate-binding domain-containing protein n=1 Tax=Roseovarius pacificus TaxID=337701 RepID=UPI004039A863
MKIGDTWVSLNALQTFEAAARHEHMGRAAQELNVTQSAVSHQVRALERALGLRLFERRGRRIEVNAAGERLLQSIQNGFDGISSTALALSTDAYSGQVSVAVPVSLMVEWLTPKLAMFLSRFPQLSLRCTYSERSMSVLPADVDMAIVFSAHVFPGFQVTPFLQTAIFPVCAPELVHGSLSLEPEVLKRATLIHEDDGEIWAQWFASRGIAQFRPARDIYAGSHHDAVAFARHGAGFAMTDWFLGGDALRAGNLVQAFGPHELTHEGYYIVTRSNQPGDSPVQALKDWLLREADRPRGADQPPLMPRPVQG